jgi:hypothetical protein
MKPFERIADTYDARIIGPGRAMAKCPAHADRHPSLSIKEGKRGILLKCWAGCSLASILAALNLRTSDLFHGPPLPAERIAELNRERSLAASIERAQVRAESTRNRRLLDLEALRDDLGGVLMASPDDAETAAAFTRTLEKFAEMESSDVRHHDPPLRHEPLPQPPSRIAHELRLMFAPEPPREHGPDVAAFDELFDWIQLQSKTARLGQAA